MTETEERLVEWEKRKCCCVVMDAAGCIQQRTGWYDPEDAYSYEVCGCCCHDIWEVEDWVNGFVPVDW